MSLRSIAKELGITPAYLSYMVNGKRPWRRDLYQRYMGIVNTSVNTKPKSSGPGLDLDTKLGPRSGPHLHGVQGAPGSNPGAPTSFNCEHLYRTPGVSLNNQTGSRGTAFWPLYFIFNSF